MIWRFWPVFLPILSLMSCTPIGVFNSAVGVEPGSRMLIDGESYGSDPRTKLDVYRPAGSATAPIVIFFYGGSWQSGRRQDYAFVGRTLAARGFVSVIPDYRLVPQVRFPDFLNDSAQAVAHVIRQARRYGGDPDRVYLFGHSAGAYNALMLAVTPRYLANAGVQRARLRAVAGLAGPYDFYPFDGQVTQEAFGQAPDPLLTQPVNVADGASPPVLLQHGKDDDTVYPRNSERLAQILRAKGREARSIFYPQIGHAGILTSFTTTFRSKGPVLDDLVAFFNAHGARAKMAGDS